MAGTDALGWSASASRRTTDGIYAFNDAYRNTVLSGRARARPDASTTVALSGRFADGAFHFPTDFTGDPTDHNQSTAERTTTLALDLTRRLGRAVDGQLLIGRHAANEAVHARQVRLVHALECRHVPLRGARHVVPAMGGTLLAVGPQR